ncbi:MAG TPA: DUF2550 domain-containing protein [Micromonosporaceae bacterium]
MRIIEWVGTGVLVVLCVLAALFIRREIIARRPGTIELSLRLSTLVPGRGWSPGIARFVGDELRWYRLFSFAIRPRRILSRRDLAVHSRRSPEGPEQLTLPSDWIVLRCHCERTPVEIAMAHNTVAGFLSWIEAAPPGAVSSRLAS